MPGSSRHVAGAGLGAPPGGAPPGPAWYVIHTRSRHEAKVEAGLRQRHLEVFLPRVAVPSRRRDRKVILDLPLFPGYLFLFADLQTQAYEEVIRTAGVVRILGHNRQFVPVPAATVQAIQTTLASDRPYYPWRFLRRGTWVRIIDGPLTGVTGIVQECREKKRKLVISVDLFCRALAVELDDDAVEPWPGP